jgi:hypothetical protein
MIVPQFWSEARRQHRSPARQVTVRRWGWSDESQDDADRLAAARAEEALAQALANPNTLRREPRVPYNGAEGVPIREEIVSQLGTAVVTRNSYGARCLNTPEVLFADVDYQHNPGCGATFATFLVVFAVGASLAFQLVPGRLRSAVAWISFFAAVVLAVPVSYLVQRLMQGGPARMRKTAIARVQAFVDSHPHWNVRIYDTPAGLRLLATHAPLDPRSSEVEEFFRAMRVDPIYRQMCLRQNCFRARLTAKPWRCGVESHMKPRPGVWPVSPERLPARRAWIEAYERQAARFAACSFVTSLGSQATHPDVAAVVRLHDHECRAMVPGLPLA